MTIREKMAEAIRSSLNDEYNDAEIYLDGADAALSVLTNPDDETVERLAQRLDKALGGVTSFDTTRAILAALKEEV